MLAELSLLVLCVLRIATALSNITIDDQDERINYVPSSSWHRVEGRNWDIGGGHMLSENTDAYAEITMTFSSFYFYSALYPYGIMTDIFLDGILIKTADLQDYDSTDDGSGGGTVASAIVASFTGTTSKQHTIRVGIPSGEDIPGYAVVDAFLFTVDILDSSSTLSSPGSSTFSTTFSSLSQSSSSITENPSSTSSSHSDSTAAAAERKSNRLAIALGVICPIVAMLLLLVFWLLCIRKKRDNAAQAPVHANNPPPDGQDGGYRAAQAPMGEVEMYPPGVVAAAQEMHRRSTQRKVPPSAIPGRRATSVVDPTWITDNPSAPTGRSGRRTRRMSFEEAAVDVVGGPPSRGPPSSYAPNGPGGDGRSIT